MEGAFRFGRCFSFFGRIVSLLGFRRRLPSPRPEAERSWFPIVACAIEGTVSVSTVMFLVGASVRDLIVESDEYEALDGSAFGRWDDTDRWSCIFPLSFSMCLVAFGLRSSETFVDVTSFRSSSDDFKLWEREGLAGN